MTNSDSIHRERGDRNKRIHLASKSA